MPKNEPSTSRRTPNRIPGAVSARGKTRPVPASILIRDDLRLAIASLRFAPGSPIHEKDLALSYGVSRTPVREAVVKLAEDGLISVFPQAGTFVARIPFHDLPEALIIRRALEEASARFAALNADAEDLAAIAATLESLRDAAARDAQESFHQADEDFHAAIAQAGGYPGLWRLTQQVKVQVDRCRRLTLPEVGRFRRVIAEHGDVFAAISRREPEAAVAAMGHHLGALLDDLGDIASRHPNCFDMTERAASARGGRVRLRRRRAEGRAMRYRFDFAALQDYWPEFWPAR